MRHAVIIAGGAGTRLWPASRRASPKQLLPLSHDGELLIVAAVALARKVAGARVVIVTSEAQAEATRLVVPGVELIAEPVARNTAAAIGLAGAMIAARDPEAVIAVLPADHHIRDREGMASALDACLTTAEVTDVIALVGIPPTRAETGFGYLEMAAGPSDGVRPVRRFVEKPNALNAAKYVSSGRHLWNAGIFCLTSRRLSTELARHLPQVGQTVQQIARDDGIVLDPDGLYVKLPSVSFDHGVMEKTDRVVALAADVGWNDVGSWAALPEIHGTAQDGNTVVDQTRMSTPCGIDQEVCGPLVIDGSGNVIVTDDGTLIALIGVSDLVIVKSGNAILIVPKDQAQRVREVVAALEERKQERWL